MKIVLTFFVGLVFTFALGCTASTARIEQPLNPPTGSLKQAATPTRTVKGQILTSTQLPAIQLEFATPFKYAGGHSFILYDVANAEQHFFVDADKDGRIKRMYWIQFEGYLPGNTHSYDYKVTKMVDIGGLNFIADAYARNIRANPGRPDSDGNRARAFLASKGYTLGSDEVISQRLVYLLDDAKRNELMIIYLEDLSPMKLTAADLAPGGKAADQWEKLSAGLLERATRNIKIA
jgi:hypothetical protein